MITPFTIDVPDELLDDLRARLRNTRWPEAELVDDWSQGTPLSYVQDVCDYWANEYDWRSREEALNRFDQYTMPVDGVTDPGVHFVHVRSPHPDAMPLLISHGWPGSIVEFHKVIEPLTVAVMGCPVNGPGEAKGADFGLAGGKGKGVIFRKGEIVRTVPESELLDALMAGLSTILSTDASLELTALTHVAGYVLSQIVEQLWVDNILAKQGQILSLRQTGYREVGAGIVGRGFFGELADIQQPALFDPLAGHCSKLADLRLRRPAQPYDADPRAVIGLDQLPGARFVVVRAIQVVAQHQQERLIVHCLAGQVDGMAKPFLGWLDHER